jgi:hypothetical protein
MPMTSAEKMAALRERQKAAQAASAAEDAYVAREVAITKHQLDTGQAKDVDADGQSLHRLARSEAYARFRWEGVADGSIAAL